MTVHAQEAAALAGALPADGVPFARAPAGAALPGRRHLFNRWVDFLALGGGSLVVLGLMAAFYPKHPPLLHRRRHLAAREPRPAALPVRLAARSRPGAAVARSRRGGFGASSRTGRARGTSEHGMTPGPFQMRETSAGPRAASREREVAGGADPTPVRGDAAGPVEPGSRASALRPRRRTGSA